MILESALALIIQLEGFSHCAFRDVSQWTNGYGTKAANKWECVSEPEAKQRLISRVKEDSAYVLSVYPKASQSEHDALVSYCYNSGKAGCRKALDLAAKGNKKAASWVMRQKINKGLKSEKGLRNRRSIEVSLLMKPVTYSEWYFTAFNR